MRIWLCGLGVGLLLLAGLFGWLGGVEGVRTEDVVIPADDAGLMLRGRMFFPSGEAPYPGVLLTHGISNAKENSEPLALALAQRGFAVLALDFGGHGESAARPLSDKVNDEDARRAMRYLASRPDIDRDRLAGYGFSMGAIPIVESARGHQGVKAIVVVGHPVEVTKEFPPNLLFGAGVYDQLVTPDALQDAVERASVQLIEFGERHGSMDAGTARQAILSAQADHPLEPWDPVLMTAAVTWIEEGVGVKHDAPAAPLTWLLPVARAAAIIGALILLLVWLHSVLGRLPEARLRSPVFRRVVAVVGGVVCAVPVLVSLTGVGPGTLLSDIGLTLLLALLVLNLVLHRHAETSGTSWNQTPRRVFIPLLGMVGVIAAAWLTTTLLFRVVFLWHNPSTLLSLPLLVLEEVGFLPGILLPKLRMMFFAEYSVRVIPSAAWYVVLVLEVAMPGRVLSVAAGTLEAAWRWLQRRKKDPPLPRRPFSWIDTGIRILMLCGLLTAFVMAALSPRSLDTLSFQRMALTVTWFVVLMVPILVLLVRLTRLPGGELQPVAGVSR